MKIQLKPVKIFIISGDKASYSFIIAENVINIMENEHSIFKYIVH